MGGRYKLSREHAVVMTLEGALLCAAIGVFLGLVLAAYYWGR